MDTISNKIRGRVSSLQEQAVENSDTSNGYFEKESNKLKGLVSARAINFIKKRKIFIISFLLIAAIGYGVYDKYFNLTDAEKAKKELAAAVASVSRYMILPENDEPVLATVTDAAALISQQTFFTGAVNGDQLLLYPKNMKAIIWSPSRKMIVNVGPIEQQPQAAVAKSDLPAEASAQAGILNPKSETSTNDQNSNTQNEIAQSSPLKIAFYNGTKTVGLANEMELKLKSVSSDFETVAKSNAENKDYKETIVIDLTGGTKSAEAQNIALALGAKVGELPSGETIPNADILIIAGR